MGAIDMFECARLQTFGEAIVFFAGYVAVSFVEEFDGLVQAPGPVEMRVNGYMVVDIFSILDGGFLDFEDGGVDFFDGCAFLFFALAAAGTFEMGARVAKVGQGVQVRGMLASGSRSRSDGTIHGRKQHRGECGNCKFGQALHVVLSC
jgi:hypothetical protein